TLKKLMFPKAEDMQAAQGLEQVSDRAFMLMDESIRFAQLGEQKDEFQTIARMEGLRREFNDQSVKLASAYQRIEQNLPQAQTKYRQVLSRTVWMFLGCNAVIFIILGIAIYKNVIARLQTMMRNTVLLTEDKSLEPQVGGTDEIGQLDAVFHDMHRAL